jgi:hypothetical protein
MKKAKVLVVDDAMLIRRMVTDVLAADPSIEVVGEAANGRIAPHLRRRRTWIGDEALMATTTKQKVGWGGANLLVVVVMFSALTGRRPPIRSKRSMRRVRLRHQARKRRRQGDRAAADSRRPRAED